MQEWLRAAFESSPDGLVALDLEGAVLFRNPAAERMRPGGDLGAVAGEDEPLFRRALQEGSPLTVGSLILVPVPGHGAVLRIREVEEQIREVNRRKDRFLAALGHELRDPMSALSASVHLLRAGLTPPQRERSLDIIQRQLFQMARIVDDLVEVSRVNRGQVRLHRDRLDLSPHVQSSVEEWRAEAGERKVRLALDLPEEPLWVDADGPRLSQALGNLLGNALRSSPPGRTITVRVREEEDEALVEVEDQGPPQSEEETAHAFDPFWELDGESRREALSLALVRGLVELHGGRVEASGSESGRRFGFRLRVAEPPTPSSEEFPASLRVLVVEDNRDAAEVLAMLLTSAGHRVEVAWTGQEALEAAARMRPHAILLDIGLPGMDGYAVARALREEPSLARTRLVALTGLGDSERSYEHGFDLHLQKPVDPDALLRMLREQV